MYVHTCMTHTEACTHMHTHKKRYVCLSAYLGQSYAPPAVSVILQIHLQPETENSDMNCTPLANRLSTITTNNVYEYNVYISLHASLYTKKCHFVRVQRIREAFLPLCLCISVYMYCMFGSLCFLPKFLV